jgi:hypothetical protein
MRECLLLVAERVDLSGSAAAFAATAKDHASAAAPTQN